MKTLDMLKRFADQLASTKTILTLGLLVTSGCGLSIGRVHTDIADVETDSRATIIGTIENVATAKDLAGAAVIINRDGEAILEHSAREYSLDTQVPIASATNSVTAALIMTVVERDGLNLDAPLSSYLPNVRPE